MRCQLNLALSRNRHLKRLKSTDPKMKVPREHRLILLIPKVKLNGTATMQMLLVLTRIQTLVPMIRPGLVLMSRALMILMVRLRAMFPSRQIPLNPTP